MVNEHEQLTSGNSNRVALKLPPWIPSDPDMWLTLVDRTFDLAKITCEYTKYSYVATALDQSVIMEVRDIVMNPPASEHYKALTKALVNRLSVSQELKTRRLLEKEEMGDSMPSQFLRRLRTVQVIIASQKDSKLDDVAELADAVTASIAPKASVFETSSRADEDRYARLEAQISALTAEMSKMRFSFDRGARTCPSSRPRFRPRSRSRSRGEDDSMCWYHRKYAEKAHRCQEPCSYSAAKWGNGQSLTATGDNCPTSRRLFITDTYTKCTVDSIRTVTGSSVFHNLLQVPANNPPRGAACVAKHQTKHHISTTPGPPVAEKPRLKRHGNKKVFIFKDLAITPQVFVRNYAPRAPLQQPYEGPFPVVQRGDKTFLVRIHGREKHISVDRLKPAYLINDQVDPQDRDPEDDPVIIPQREETAAPRREPEPTHAAPGPVRTRSGRRVRFPDRYQAGFF
ncbi:hypothetical protein NQ318_003733 [Aromia moschata]|uniref:DUF7041 domain-containing protein n=1 Tax=Aromia moschata TaxID=1265417 RepID=A0AAV8X5P0_9CUCU|nr:hypothetical protein NQ318_003733 [Aromia moschata]